jgi:hypothetical protein
MLLGDKGYDTNAIRQKVEEKGTMPNIPPKANRRWKNCFSPFLYRDRNTIDIDQTWRLSRICWWGEAWRPPVPRRRGRTHRFQGGDGVWVGMDQLGVAGAHWHQAAA